MRAFEVLCPFFNIRSNGSVFLYFFHIKLIGKIGWVSLNGVSNFFFEFDSNIFCRFKDRFFKVQAISVMADGLPLMFSRDGEPHFSFYWKSSPTMFNSFDKDLLTLVERVEKVILDHLSASLDARTILSLLLASDPIATLDGKYPALCSPLYLGYMLTLVVLFLFVLQV